MYRDLGFIRVWGALARAPRRGRIGEDPRAGAPYAYLVYPHKPVVAYLPQTRELLNEYCVEFPDETRPYGSARLPDSDDVLAKWMALQGDERRLIAEANLHLPGRQRRYLQHPQDIVVLGSLHVDHVGPVVTQAHDGRAQLSRTYLCLEGYLDLGAALEIDAVVGTGYEQGDKAGAGQNQGDRAQEAAVP